MAAPHSPYVIVHIDLREIVDLASFHAVFKRAMGFPEFIAVLGCASHSNPSDALMVAGRLNISPDEVVELARSAAHQHNIVVARITAEEDGSIQVWLTDVPGRLHGIAVVFRKVNGHWQEDPSAQGEWVV